MRRVQKSRNGALSPSKRVEIRGRQLVAKGVFASPIDADDRAMRQQRTERKAFAFGQFQPGVRFAGIGDILLALHHALLDDQKTLHRTLFRRDDHFAPGIVGEPHALQHPQQMRLFHPIERRVSGEE